MQPDEDLVRLRHMLDAAEEALEFAVGRTRADLDADHQLMRAIQKSIEIIGEAARHVSEPVRVEHPEIAWSEIAGMRNRMVHRYFDVDLDILWRSVTEELPPLVATLRSIISGLR